MRLVAILCVLAATVLGFPDKLIRCKVCDRAMHHVWMKAVELRHKCRHHYTESGHPDERCDYSNVHPWAVNQMVWGVCDALPVTYQAVLKDEDFRIIATEGDPAHTEEAARAIKESCVRWLHTVHTAESVGNTVLGNLEVGKTTEVILKSLKKRFCQKACQDHPTHEFSHEDRDEL